MIHYCPNRECPNVDLCGRPGKCAAVNRVTPREMDMLKALLAGDCNKQAAARMGISIKTIEKHRQALYRKLGVNHIVGLIRMALFHKLVTLEEFLGVSRQETVEPSPPAIELV